MQPFATRNQAFQRAKKFYLCRSCLTSHSPKNPEVCSRCGKREFWKFDSTAELKRFSTLVLLLKAGDITNLRIQVPFYFVVNGVKIGKYIADAVYIDKSGKEIVEDTKATQKAVTELFRYKRKLMLACHGIEVKVYYDNPAKPKPKRRRKNDERTTKPSTRLE